MVDESIIGTKGETTIWKVEEGKIPHKIDVGAVISEGAVVGGER